MVRWLSLIFTHGAMLAVGFALGVYFLPILTAPPGPDQSELSSVAATALFKGHFDRNLKGSDLLHWGEGEVSVTPLRIAHTGRLAPGPDYKLYLTTEFVDNPDDFLRIKAQSRRIGDVKTFDGFIVEVPQNVDVMNYTSVVIWCEAFSQFISAARFR